MKAYNQIIEAIQLKWRCSKTKQFSAAAATVYLFTFRVHRFSNSIIDIKANAWLPNANIIPQIIDFYFEYKYQIFSTNGNWTTMKEKKNLPKERFFVKVIHFNGSIHFDHVPLTYKHHHLLLLLDKSIFNDSIFERLMNFIWISLVNWIE